MNLGFDIDGVVADLATVMVDHINKEYSLNHTSDVFQNYYLINNKYTNNDKLNLKIAHDVKEKVIDNPEALMKIKPYDNVRKILLILRKSGHQLFFITARNSSFYDLTIKWFRKNKIPFDKIFMAENGEKGLLGRVLNLDFYIDDFHEHLEDMYRYKKRWHKGLILFNRPWNSNVYIDANKFTRLDNWEEVIRIIGIKNR